jgi:hypothetical protein
MFHVCVVGRNSRAASPTTQTTLERPFSAEAMESASRRMSGAVESASRPMSAASVRSARPGSTRNIIVTTGEQTQIISLTQERAKISPVVI